MPLLRGSLRSFWFLAVMLGVWVSDAHSDDRRVVWEPNPNEEAVVGYRVHYGSVSRSDPLFAGYAHVLEVGNVLGVDVERLRCGSGVCYVAVTARNALGFESDYSEELAVTVASTETPPATGTSSAGGGGGGCFLAALSPRRP